MAKLQRYGYDFYHEKYFVEGKTTNEIADELGVAGSSVVRRMRKLGIELRKPVEVHCAHCRSKLFRKKSSVMKRMNFYCSKLCESEHKKITMSGAGNPFYGRKHSAETKKKFSRIHKGKEIPLEIRKRISKALSGSNSPNWRDGACERNRNDRMKMEYRAWRTAVFERDKYTCQRCEKVGGQLAVHHILNFSQHEHLRFDTNNGVVLCEPCHIAFHKRYGKKDNNRDQLNEFTAKVVMS